MMVTDVSKLSIVGANELEDNSISLVYSEAPHLMMLRVQLFSSQRRVKGIVFEEFGFCGGLPLNGSW